jgi:integrase
VRYVTSEEFHKVLNTAKTLWFKALLSLAYTSAARLNEILNLTWADLDFEQNRIRIARKDADTVLGSWEPKDHEGRLLPVPQSLMQTLADLQVEAAEGCPYVFVPAWRWKHIRSTREAGTWREAQLLVNNLIRRLATLRKWAGVAKFTFHDLRRSCITNWARHLPVHVVQKLAGHSDIKTTQQHYLSVQPDDLETARSVQAELLAARPRDQLLTNSGQKRPFGQEATIG